MKVNFIVPPNVKRGKCYICGKKRPLELIVFEENKQVKVCGKCGVAALYHEEQKKKQTKNPYIGKSSDLVIIDEEAFKNG